MAVADDWPESRGGARCPISGHTCARVHLRGLTDGLAPQPSPVCAPVVGAPIGASAWSSAPSADAPGVVRLPRTLPEGRPKVLSERMPEKPSLRRGPDRRLRGCGRAARLESLEDGRAGLGRCPSALGAAGGGQHARGRGGAEASRADLPHRRPGRHLHLPGLPGVLRRRPRDHSLRRDSARHPAAGLHLHREGGRAGHEQPGVPLRRRPPLRGAPWSA